MRKRLLAIFMSLAMIVTYMPASVAYAAEGSSEKVDAEEFFKNLECGTIGELNRIYPDSDEAKTGEDLITPSDEAVLAEAGAEEGETGDKQDQDVKLGDIEAEKFDLRNVDDKCYVTPVKLQNPFGSCWGFAVTSAAETSLLTSMGLSYDPDADPLEEGISEGQDTTNIDLSEHHLAWFAGTALPEDDSSGQGGEGAYATEGLVDKDGNVQDPEHCMDFGGATYYGTSLYASAIGPVPDSMFPYKPKGEEIQTAKVKDEETGEEKEINWCYSEKGDWSIDEENRFGVFGELAESAILPSPAPLEKDDEGNDVLNETAVDAIKSELVSGRAVSIAFCADTYKPDQKDKETGEDKVPMYINTNNEDGTWAHYTYDTPSQDNGGAGAVNHAVTIVGWDDSYSSDHFVTSDKTGLDRTVQPPGDGAWIVKNSWGAAGNDFPNWNKWGSNGTGYFYLSYYDKSVANPETFSFDIEVMKSDSSYSYINQYDYLPSGGVYIWQNLNSVLMMANVFTAEDGDMTLRAVSTSAMVAGATVAYEIYRLNDNYKDPTDGELVGEIAATYDYAGYHRENLEEYLDEPVHFRKGEKYSVVVAQVYDNGDGEKRCAMGSAYGISEQGAKKYKYTKYSKTVVNEGESWAGTSLFGKTTWIDWAEAADYIANIQYEGDVVIDNFPIKTYSDPYDGFEDINDADVTMNATAFPYNGKAQTPALYLSVDNGKTKLVKGTDFKVTYSNNKNVGLATATVKGIGKYSGSFFVNFKINPKGTTIKAPAALKKGFTAKWAKQSTKMANSRITGYQVRYSAKKSMAGAKIKTVAGYGKTSAKVSNLKAKKKYYMQVRTYKTVNGRKYYSKWSAKKSVTTK